MTRFAEPATLLAFVLLSLPASAESTDTPTPTADHPDPHPRISIVHPGANSVRADLEYLLSLTTPEEQKQWENVDDFLDSFMGGVDVELPIRVDLILRDTALFYISSFPVNDVEEFLYNIDLLGITSRRKAAQLFQLSELFEGWLRIKDKYGTFAEDAADVPPNFPDRQAAIADLLKREFDIATEIVNEDTSQAAIDSRHAIFQKIIDELLGLVEQRPDEVEVQYELRKNTFRHQLEILQRGFAQTRHLVLGWETDEQVHTGGLVFELSPIAETALAAEIDLQCQEPGRFAAIERSESAILSGRIKYRIAQHYKVQLNEFWALTHKNVLHRIQADDTRSAEEKESFNSLANLVLEVINATTESRVVDGFVELVPGPNDGHTLVGGGVVPDDTDILPVLELIPYCRTGWEVELNIETVGDIAIHRVKVQIDRATQFTDFFGTDSEFLVGTGTGVVWLATGEGSLTALKTAIETLNGENPGLAEDPFIDVQIRFGDWLSLLDRVCADDPEPVDEDEKTQREERDALRALALQAFEAGEDRLSIRAARAGDQVKGRMTVESAILRFVGKAIADFSKENLDFDDE